MSRGSKKAMRRKGRQIIVHSATEAVSLVSLDDRAASIRDHLAAADTAAAEAIDHSIRAGQELIEARCLVEPGRWIEWCKANIGRSRRDISRLIGFASADDPRAALEAHRSSAREGMRQTRRVRGPNVSPMPSPLVEVVSATPALIIDVGTPSAPNDDIEAAAEWLLENMPDGINETLRGVLAPFSGLPLARLLDALKVLDFEPIPLVKGAFTSAPAELARAA